MRKAALLLILTLLLFPFFQRDSFACEPAGGDNWFTEEITFEKNNFPKGVSIYQDEPFYSYEKDVHGPISFVKNESNISLYIIPKIASEPTQTPSQANRDTLKQPSSTLKPRTAYRLVSGKVYYFNNPNEVDLPEEYAWEGGDTGGLDIDYSKLASLANIEIENVYKDNRPANQQVPATTDFSLKAFFDDEPLEIKGNIKYQLNNDYNPQQDANDACKKSLAKATADEALRERNSPRDGAFLLGSVAGFLLLLVSLTIGYYVYKKSKGGMK
jgi:hypothetical protein